MLATEKLYTVEEFLAYQAQYPDKLLELIDGRIVKKVTGQIHAIIALIIGTALRNWQVQNKVVGQAGVEMSHRNQDDDKNLLIPDVSFRYTDETPTVHAAPQMPDFAVEIKSPSNSYKELREKAEFYLANGGRLVWLVYPEKQIVEVYYQDGTSEICRDEDVLAGREVLPAFQMTVNEIFSS